METLIKTFTQNLKYGVYKLHVNTAPGKYRITFSLKTGNAQNIGTITMADNVYGANGEDVTGNLKKVSISKDKLVETVFETKNKHSYLLISIGTPNIAASSVIINLYKIDGDINEGNNDVQQPSVDKPSEKPTELPEEKPVEKPAQTTQQSIGGMNVWIGTLKEFNACKPHDSKTLYLIKQ